jgi:hypothetical protein
MTVRREIARKRVPREAYLVSRMQRNRHTFSVLRFTLHELRFTRKRGESAIAAEVFMNNAGQKAAAGRRQVTRDG